MPNPMLNSAKLKYEATGVKFEIQNGWRFRQKIIIFNHNNLVYGHRIMSSGFIHQE